MLAITPGYMGSNTVMFCKGPDVFDKIIPQTYHDIEMIIGSIMTIIGFFSLILFNPAIRGISNVGTVKDPTIYQISTAYSKSIASIMENTAVIPSPHFV